MKPLALLTAFSLVCWMVMFLAGHDVWHFAGRPDFWNLSGPPNADLRGFSSAFYLQCVLLVAQLAFIGWQVSAGRRKWQAASG